MHQPLQHVGAKHSNSSRVTSPCCRSQTQHRYIYCKP